MGKWLKNLLGLVIVAYLLWYLARRWDQLGAILQLTPAVMVGMYGLCAVISMTSAAVVRRLLCGLDASTRFWEMVCLQNAAALLNYAPMKLGTVFRANYLKRHYGLIYAHFATFFLYITFLMTLIAALVGLVMMLAAYGFAGPERRTMAVVFIAAALGSCAALILPLPIPTGAGRFKSILRNFLTGRQNISRQYRTVIVAAAMLMVNFLLTALRLTLIYHSVGQPIHPAGGIVLGALAFVTLFVSLTPGALGIKELTLTFGGVVLGVPAETAILAAMIDRAVTVSYAFVVGGGCAIYLWRKSPADFHSTRNTPDA